MQKIRCLDLNAIGPAPFRDGRACREEEGRRGSCFSERNGPRFAPSQLLRCRFPAADRGYPATRYEASEPEHIGKSVPIVRWTASAIFNAPEGGKVDGPQRSSVLRIEMGFKGTISIGLCQFEGMAEAKGHKMEMVVKGLHYMGCWSQ